MVIVSGTNDSTSSGGVGKLYINGKLVDKSLDLPINLDKITVGQLVGLTGKWKSLANPVYHDSILGKIRIYNRPLDKYEVDTNYYSLAKNYGLEVSKESTHVKHGLIREFPVKSSKITKVARGVSIGKNVKD